MGTVLITREARLAGEHQIPEESYRDILCTVRDSNVITRAYAVMLM